VRLKAETIPYQYTRDQAVSIPTTDTFQNFLARLGHGTGNLNDGAQYGFHPVTRLRLQLEWMYRGSWVAGKVVDSIAEDMTREGVDIHSDMKPPEIQEFEKEIDRLQIWAQLCQTIKYSRLYGGAIAYIHIDGQDPSTPLRKDTIAKGAFRGLVPMDRWLLLPSLNDLVQEVGPAFRKPKYYQTVTDSNTGVPRMRIHYSRVIRLEGIELPYWQALTENLWGISVIERLWDRMVAFDSVTTGAAQLVYKAHLRTLQIKDLRKILALSDPAAKKGLYAQISLTQYFQGQEGFTVLDADDKFETHQYAFGGLPDVMLQFGQQIAGATDIPLVRLFGQSPAGLNSTGESDLRTYYDGIKQKQIAAIGPGVETVYDIAYRSKFGKPPPKSFELPFRALWQLTSEQKAAATKVTTDSIVQAYESGLIQRDTGLKELRSLSRDVGTWASITDEEIEEAEEAVENAPSPEDLATAAHEASIAPGPGDPNGGRSATETQTGPKPGAAGAGGAKLRAVP
jgi:phage-related protein (TIGR01555 family)